MCFSATASFIAGTGLSVLGVATLRATRRKEEIPFAAIPLLFGFQQIVEGVLWLSGHVTIRLFGVTDAFFVIALVSVCWIFAAILSSIIYVHFSLAAPKLDVSSADRRINRGPRALT